MRYGWLLPVLLMLRAATAEAQQPRIVRGTVVADRAPVSGGNVFILETLEGALTDSIGRFEFLTTAPEQATLVVQHVRYRELRQPLLGDTETRIELQTAVIILPELNVLAGRYSVGFEAGVELTSIDVVRTPGAAADVYRALQTFPGLQSVDEGAGLFVRGGDVSETRIYLNDAVVLSPYKYESPTGGFFGSFDPFLLDGIYFSSGGFGARYGDALSGVAALSTLGRPARLSLGATASLAGVSGSGAVPVGSSAGVRATLTRSRTELMFKVNGHSTRFTREPEGRDASVIAVLQYASGEVRLFSMDQWSRLGEHLEEPSFSGALDSRSDHRAAVLGWDHSFGRTMITATVGRASAQHDVSFGAYELVADEAIDQLRLKVETPAGPLGRATAGGELIRRSSSFDGRTPERSYDNAENAPTRRIDGEVDDTRSAGFIELDRDLGERLRVIAGVRADRSTLTREATMDPRLSLAYRPTELVTFTSAWGVYHQIPDPELFERHESDLRPMRAEHRVLGAQFGAGDALLRVEAYEKRYGDLSAINREGLVAEEGAGRTRGVDLFARWPEWRGMSGRVSYSFVHATRTDADTRVLARSPFDITHSVAMVIDRSFGSHWQLSVARRYATGRPVTPVTGAARDSARNVWIPLHGAPYSERLPAFSRSDVSVSRRVSLARESLLVLFAAVNNVFDRKNVHAYQYSPDYSTRTPVRSQFRRSIYFGASLTF